MHEALNDATQGVIFTDQTKKPFQMISEHTLIHIDDKTSTMVKAKDIEIGDTILCSNGLHKVISFYPNK